MNAITPLNHMFNHNAILGSIGDGLLESSEFNEKSQLSITHAEGDSGLFSSVGTLYDYTTETFTMGTGSFTNLHTRFMGTYLEQVVDEVGEIARDYGVSLGRVRLLMLHPMSCYSYHRDPEEFRFHIPLITNPDASFVCDLVVSQMPECGRLYQFRTNQHHTAVNCSPTEKRLHLVFDTVPKTQSHQLGDRPHAVSQTYHHTP